MARVPIRDLLRLRTTSLSHPTSLITSKSNLSSSSSPIFSPSLSSPDSTAHPQTFYHYPQIEKLLNVCRHMTHLFQIQAVTITSGLFRDLSLSSKVLRISSDLCDIDSTVLIFQCIDFPDAFCVNTVIKAYGCSSEPGNAVVFYFEMLRDGVFPNNFTFPPLMSSCAKIGCLKSGQKCHGQAVKNGVDGVLPVQNSLIHFYSSSGLTDLARQVFVEMSDRDLVSWNSIINGLAKHGNIVNAHQLFDKMPEKNVVSWNIMIAGYLNNANPGLALKLFRKMLEFEFKSNDSTIVSVLTACGRSASLKEGRSVHGYLLKNLLNSSLSLIIDTALIDMYSKCEKTNAAQTVFDRMRSRNLVCWNAMILGNSIHGNPEHGLNLFLKMVGRNTFDEHKIQDHRVVFQPDEITFVGVLCACARKGLLNEGKRHFNEMYDIYGVKPNFAHYWCMANLYSGTGLIQEAIEILKNIPINEDFSFESSFWAGLLGICRFQGDVSLGEEIAKAKIEVDPHDFTNWVLLLNIYAVAGRWEDVGRLKELMKDRGVERVPACGLVDLVEIVHNAKV